MHDFLDRYGPRAVDIGPVMKRRVRLALGASGTYAVPYHRARYNRLVALAKSGERVVCGFDTFVRVTGVELVTSMSPVPAQWTMNVTLTGA